MDKDQLHNLSMALVKVNTDRLFNRIDDNEHVRIMNQILKDGKPHGFTPLQISQYAVNNIEKIISQLTKKYPNMEFDTSKIKRKGWYI